MEKGPAWHCVLVTLDEAPDEEPHLLLFRNIKECNAHLLGNPTFEEHMDYAPVEIFTPDGQRVYNEMASGLIWNELQVSAAVLCAPIEPMLT